MDVHVESRDQPSRIRALLVSDVRLYREGVELALRRREAIELVATASSIGEAVDRAAAHHPAVILLDMATRESVAGIRALTDAAPRSKIIAFAVDEQAADIPSYAEAGIAGYVPCEASIDDLAATIACVTRDEATCSPRVAGALFRRITTLAAGRPTPAAASPLSQREHEILALIRSGCSNKDIARTLTIEVATAKNHVHNLLTKLKVSTRAEAAAFGTKNFQLRA